MPRSLLWIDDDEPERFEGEVELLEGKEWTVQTARSVEEAAQALEHSPFDVILLDSMLASPGGSEDWTVLWGGCRLLYWLRGNAAKPWPQEDQSWAHLEKLQPKESNRRARVALISAYHHRDLLERTREASMHDANIRLFGKPVDFDALLEFLESDHPAR